jgi:hypothetical protein
MAQLSPKESQIINTAYQHLRAQLAQTHMSLELRDDFDKYTAIRHQHGDRHLNQAFDPDHVKFGSDDFWLLVENDRGEAIATYCLRRFVVADFFDLIRSLALWFFSPRFHVDPRFTVECEIAPFGGEVVHGGGLWIREDYRGLSRLAIVMPRFARAVALLHRPFDHDSAMIRNEPQDPATVAGRKATFMGRQIYGYARVHRFVDGWFPPEKRNAIMHLCHATRAEAIASLSSVPVLGRCLRRDEFGEPSLVDQHYKAVHSPAVLGQWDQQASI